MALDVQPVPSLSGAPRAAYGLPPHRAELIARSHERCTALGLTRIERPDYAPLIRSDLAVARERTRRLFNHAAPVMELLQQQVAGTDSMIVLTDAQGTILHSVGDDDILQRAGKVALRPGVNWAEHSKGTNAIGTALFEESPTLVHAGEHYMHANHFLTCSAAPIFDPRGEILGVLDVSSDHRAFHPHTMGLVRVSARMIENHWLSDDCSDRLRLHFHARPEFIGSLLEGIVVVDEGGRIVGANRSALDQLGLGGAAIRSHSLSSLFGTTLAAVADHVRSAATVPMRLAGPDGSSFHVSARAHGSSRPWVRGAGAAGIAEAAEVVDAVPAPATVPPPRRTPGGQAGGLQALLTGDVQLEAVVQKVRRVLDRDIPLLILGETGTGKELLARAVHHDSQRARQPFVAVNCASIPESLIEAELFGYEDGAFTGARRKGSPGRIVQASGGTLFLDEIGDMPLALQARLLRVLQERSVTPLGGQRAIPVDIAVIGATHRHLREMIDRHQFREDLYYRLNGLAVRLPALRDRSDLAEVARRILQAQCPGGAPALSPGVMALLRRSKWPGNLRQLANVLRTAAVMAGGEAQITEQHLSDDFLEDTRAPVASVAAGLPVDAEAPASASAPPATATLGEAEIALVRRTLDDCGGNISEASKRLGISRNTIYRKLRKQQPAGG